MGGFGRTNISTLQGGANIALAPRAKEQHNVQGSPKSAEGLSTAGVHASAYFTYLSVCYLPPQLVGGLSNGRVSSS